TSPRIKKKLEKHFKIVEKASTALHDKKKGPLGVTGMTALFLNARILTVIKNWKKLDTEKEEIFSQKNKFIEILNNLFQRKTVSTNNENKLEITTQSGKSLPIQQLSSGEKQLLIVLGQALLQKEQPWIYIADEPELSLHVKWQDALVDTIKILNPNAQIIFAT